MTQLATLDLLAQRHNRARNRLHTWLLSAACLLLLAMTAWAFGGPSGIVYVMVFGIPPLFLLRRISPHVVLSMYKAKRVSAADFPVGYRIVQELARRASLPAVPHLYVIPSRMVNAFAVGSRDDSAIAITDALARTLTARELAGVLAHEISHVAHGDVKVMAFADMVSRFTSIMSIIGIFSLFLNLAVFAGGYEIHIPWLAVAVLLAAPTIGGLLQMALSRTREFDADLGAAMLTGDPDGLAAALRKLEKAQGKIWEGVLLPGSRVPEPSILRSHPVTGDRVERLMALKAQSDDGAEFEDGPPVVIRRSSVPRIRLMTPQGILGAQSLLQVSEAEPACDHALNPPRSRPHIHLLRGGVWW